MLVPLAWGVEGALSCVRSSCVVVESGRSATSKVRRRSACRTWLWHCALAGCMLAVVALASAGRARAASWSMQPVAPLTGPNSELSAVSCSSSGACVAVGSGAAGPLAEQWTGRRWTLEHTARVALGNDPTEVAFDAVSCSSRDACTAVGSDQSERPLIERWNGRRWLLQKLSANRFASALSSVSCATATSCVAVGDDGVERWDGRRWRQQPIQTSTSWVDFSLGSVACGSASACMTVGYSEYGGCTSGGCNQHPLVELWNGDRWATLSAPKLRGATLASVSCRSSTNCVVVGTFTPHRSAVMFAARWNGSTCAVRRIPAPRGGGGARLGGVSCASARDCVAIGSFFEPGDVQAPFTVHWNGQNWRLAHVVVADGDTQLSVSGVSCEPNQTCIAVGGFVNAVGQRATLVERWLRSRWSVQPSPNSITDIDAELNDVSCASDASCMAVGSTVNVDPGTPLVERWNGSAWTIQKLPAGARSSSFNAVSCPTPSVCAAVGSYTVNSGQFQAVASVASNGQWSIERVIPPGAFDSSLSGVSCASITDCVAVGYYQLEANSAPIPFAEVWIGTAWSIQVIPVPASDASAALGRVSCGSTNACITVGSYTPPGSNEPQPLAEGWNGATWESENPAAQPGGTFASLDGISCESATVCTAVGNSGTSTGGHGSDALAEMWTGASWTLLNASSPSNTNNRLTADSCPTATLCVAVGDKGSGTALAEAWNGSTWSSEQTPAVAARYFDSGLNGVSCGSATTCLAVGTLVSTGPSGESYRPFSERRS